MISLYRIAKSLDVVIAISGLFVWKGVDVMQ